MDFGHPSSLLQPILFLTGLGIPLIVYEPGLPTTHAVCLSLSVRVIQEDTERNVLVNKARFLQEIELRRKIWQRIKNPRKVTRPAFVVGSGRSGTSMLKNLD